MSTTPKANRTTHTPGPWRATFSDLGGYDCMTHAWRIDSKAQSIATLDLGSYGQKPCHHAYKSVTAEANARLIATAPELLSALRALTEAAEFDFCGESTVDCADSECVAMEDGSAFTFGMIRQARALIAKAEGR